MSMNLEDYLGFVWAALGGRYAPRLAVAFILGVPLRMAISGLHASLPSVQFLAAINEFNMGEYGLATTAIIFSPMLIGRQWVADRTLGEVRDLHHLLANAPLDSDKKLEKWDRYVDNWMEARDPRLKADMKNYRPQA